MKIAHIYDAIYPWIEGGAEKRIYAIKPFFREESFTKENFD